MLRIQQIRADFGQERSSRGAELQTLGVASSLASGSGTPSIFNSQSVGTARALQRHSCSLLAGHSALPIMVKKQCRTNPRTPSHPDQNRRLSTRAHPNSIHLLELLQLRIPEHDKTVLARSDIAAFFASRGAGVHRSGVGCGASMHAVGLQTATKK